MNTVLPQYCTLVIAIGAISVIEPVGRDLGYGYSYALSHCSWVLASTSAGFFFWQIRDENNVF